MDNAYANAASQSITFDTETTGLNPRLDELKVVCFGQGIEHATLRHPEDQEEIQSWLDRDAYYIAHNSTFDWSFLEQKGYKLPPYERWRDTQIVAHVAGQRMPGQTALDTLTKYHVKQGDLDEAVVLRPEQELKKRLSVERSRATRKGLPYPQKGHMPAYLLHPYCMMDVQLTQWMAVHYGNRIDGQESILELEHRVLPAIYDTQRRGAPIDKQAARSLRESVNTTYTQAQEKIKNLAGEDFNDKATRQIEQKLRERGVPVDDLPRTPKSGAPKLDANTLATIDDELAQGIVQMRLEKKMVDYADALMRFSHKGRLYGTFRQVGTTTGRMSSGQPNLQNLPAGDLRVRNAICTTEGNILVGADYDSMELRMLAYYAKGGEVERAFKEGLDLHKITGEGVGISRSGGKLLNFAVLYGAGVGKVSRILGISEPEAKEVLDRWYKTYPEVDELKKKIKINLETYGYIETLLGRRHRLDVQKHYIALNYLIQGSCADVFKTAVAELHEKKMPAILYVHDEIVLEVAEDQADDAADILTTTLESASDEVELVAEANTARRWSDLK